ncbi:Histone H1 [Dissostichus eleginoides]|uniref:Histone H1 n=1 Tax=Dissostichus eleginoides TaxID=100907 RepID=A0AAD9FHM7_DISEL|nr:Histone H1 [Dissostichus eleginoides]
MAESAPAAAAPAKSLKKTATKPKKAGPSAADLVLKAVTASKERKGISYVALKKELAVKGIDNANQVKRAVKKLVENGALVQVKGTGASGSFKAAKAAEKPKKPRRSNTQEGEEACYCCQENPREEDHKEPEEEGGGQEGSTQKAATPKKAVKKVVKPAAKAVKKAPARKASKK